MSEPVGCESCGRGEGEGLCDDCYAEQVEQDDRRAELLAEEDRHLYGVRGLT